MTPRRRANIARYRSTLAAIGIGAVVGMGLISLVTQQATGHASVSTTHAAPPRMTLGVTKTKEAPPTSPMTASATPPVRALPAPGTRPGM